MRIWQVQNYPYTDIFFTSTGHKGISELDTAFKMLDLTGTDNLSYLFRSNL